MLATITFQHSANSVRLVAESIPRKRFSAYKRPDRYKNRRESRTIVNCRPLIRYCRRPRKSFFRYPRKRRIKWSLFQGVFKRRGRSLRKRSIRSSPTLDVSNCGETEKLPGKTVAHFVTLCTTQANATAEMTYRPAAKSTVNALGVYTRRTTTKPRVVVRLQPYVRKEPTKTGHGYEFSGFRSKSPRST